MTTADAPNLYVSADLEGVTGVTRIAELSPAGGADYQAARRWMTLDVNACIDGVRQVAPTADVTVEENHGAEDLCVLDLDLLDPGTSVVRGAYRGRTTTAVALTPEVDGLILIGHHAAVGHPGGLLAHTAIGGLTDVRVDGRTRSEGEFFTFMAAEIGVPLLAVSGDDVICQQLEELVPTIETAVVKHALASQAARHLPSARAREAITSACHRGTARLVAGDTSVPATSPGHRLDIDLGQLAGFAPLLVEAGFGSDKTGVVHIDITTWAQAWERLAFVGLVALRHRAAGVANPDPALVADLAAGLQL
jgi:D-amino peptidase